MEIPEYKSNSHKSKEQNSEVVEREKIEKVVSGTVKIKKKSGFRKFVIGSVAEKGLKISKVDVLLVHKN